MTWAPELPLGRATIDRASDLRTDPDWIDRLWRQPQTRVLRVHEGQVLISGEPPQLVLIPPEQADNGERYFLGLDPGQTAYFAIVAPFEPGPTHQVVGLRAVGSVLGDRDVGLLVHALALTNWHATHGHCARCGAPTEPAPGGHLRRCSADGSEHFPRTDPAVIMLVHADDRALLGRQPSWPERRFSTLAGFVEPGESAEHAVIREVWEESGVEVSDVHYLGSQPWPFPSNLMLGFTARAKGTTLRLNEELAEANWYSRAELAGAVSDGSVLLPPRVSIARRLIEAWYGGSLPTP